VRCKITIAGVGRVGSQVARSLAERDDADLVLVDTAQRRAEGRALDLNQAGALAGYEARHVGTTSWEEAAGCEVVVICCGSARQPGQRREDLVTENAAVVREIGRTIAERCPDAVAVVVTTPVDVMCHVMLGATGFPRARVIGVGGVIDSARFRASLAGELGVSARDVEGTVLGAHDDSMVPLLSSARAHGGPVRLAAERADVVLAHTREGAGEILQLAGDGAAQAPAAGVEAVVEAVMHDTKRVLPCSAFCQGEYGLDDVFVGVPVRLGRDGVEEIVELELDDDERAALKRSAAGVTALVDALR
jgi:malate dehydrogenase